LAGFEVAFPLAAGFSGLVLGLQSRSEIPAMAGFSYAKVGDHFVGAFAARRPQPPDGRTADVNFAIPEP
jgi:hypothetical protein